MGVGERGIEEGKGDGESESEENVDTIIPLCSIPAHSLIPLPPTHSSLSRPLTHLPVHPPLAPVILVVHM